MGVSQSTRLYYTGYKKRVIHSEREESEDTNFFYC